MSGVLMREEILADGPMFARIQRREMSTPSLEGGETMGKRHESHKT
jgi:UDP-N-acetylglucosamine enolpyruvyl transferase